MRNGYSDLLEATGWAHLLTIFLILLLASHENKIDDEALTKSPRIANQFHERRLSRSSSISKFGLRKMGMLHFRSKFEVAKHFETYQVTIFGYLIVLSELFAMPSNDSGATCDSQIFD